MTKVIAEIGINHNGDYDKAKRLINYAVESGCWGVKFQFRGDDFFSENDEMGSTLIREELENSNLKAEWILELINFCKTKEIKIGFSFFSIRDLHFFMKKPEWSLDFIKIPSPEFRNINLIHAAKSFSELVMVSYGGGKEDEILSCINKSQLRKNDVAFHCISNYPVSAGNQQLDFLNRINNNSNVLKGYSSHDEDWEINLIAANYGIDFIERHLCESKKDIGLDISTSSDPKEFKKLIYLLSKYNEIKQCEKREPNQGEILNVRNLGTSLYSSSDLSKGSNVDIADIIEKSPAIGLTMSEYLDLESRVLLKPLSKGESLLKGHFVDLNKKINNKSIDFANENRLSLPVRLHDFEAIANKFKFNYYELHLSYKELKSLSDNGFGKLLSTINKSYTVSIHLPDYISKDELISPFSKRDKIKKESRNIIDCCVSLAKEIKLKTGKQSLILGSFSMNEFDNENEFYLNYKNYVNKIKDSTGISILAQWLPKMAWYFGGSVKVDLFSSEKDIELCLKYEIPICLDIAHLILSANYYNKNWKKWYDKLIPLCEHIHLSDAVGIDGEGVSFGKGDIHSLTEMLVHPSIKVLEIWEGHLDEGEKFSEALNYLFLNKKS
jgi:sialic acid synthase SpsE